MSELQPWLCLFKQPLHLNPRYPSLVSQQGSLQSHFFHCKHGLLRRSSTNLVLPGCRSRLRGTGVAGRAHSMDRIDLSFLEPSTSVADRHPEVERLCGGDACTQRFMLPQVQDVRALHAQVSRLSLEAVQLADAWWRRSTRSSATPWHMLSRTTARPRSASSSSTA